MRPIHSLEKTASVAIDVLKKQQLRFSIFHSLHLSCRCLTLDTPCPWMGGQKASDWPVWVPGPLPGGLLCQGHAPKAPRTRWSFLMPWKNSYFHHIFLPNVSKTNPNSGVNQHALCKMHLKWFTCYKHEFIHHTRIHLPMPAEENFPCIKMTGAPTPPPPEGCFLPVNGGGSLWPPR